MNENCEWLFYELCSAREKRRGVLSCIRSVQEFVDSKIKGI